MADIVIRGMEMPKDQPVLVFIWPDGRVFPAGLYKNSEWDRVKATPLPEGHGELIDRDTVKKHKWIAGVSSVVSVQAIDDAPTIVPAEGGTDK